MPTYIRQPSFLGGELSPLLWGRTDLPIFGRGLRGCRNFFVKSSGALVSRPGSTFIRTTKDPNGTCRLIPFVFSDTQSYAIEVGQSGADLYFRFHTGGGTLETIPGSGVPYEASTSTSGIGNVGAPDLAKLKWAQTGDILTLAHPDLPAFELRRYPNTGAGAPDWRVSKVVFAVAAPYFNNAAGGYPVLKLALPVADATHPAKEWIWLATQVVQDIASGRVFETLPFRINETWDGVVSNLPVALTTNQTAVYFDRPVTIWRKNGSVNHLEVAVNTANATFTELGTNYYRGQGNPFDQSGLYGFVGASTTDTFVDTGKEPDYRLQPPRGTRPFTAAEFPRSVAFFQDRRCFGGTQTRPASTFLSALGRYTNFDRHSLQVKGESLLYEMAARRLEEIVHLTPHQKLIVSTKSSHWTVTGDLGNAIDFDHLEFRLVDEVGAADLPPLTIDGSVLFARAKGTGVRSLTLANDNYQGADVSLAAEHLFLGDATGFQGTVASRKLVDWTYARDPWGLVWAVREDGTLLSLTHHGESAAWARHDGNATSRGSAAWYRRVCAVPEGTEDAVYMIVTRAVGGSYGKNCVERMTSRLRRNNPEDDACVDCAVRYQGVPTLVLAGLTHLIGESVWAVSVGNPPYGPLVVDGAGQITLPELPKENSGGFDNGAGNPHFGGDVIMFVGLLFTPELETLDMAQGEARMKQKTVTQVGLEVDQSRGLWAGQDFAHLKEWKQRDVAAGYSAPVPTTQLIRMAVSGTWSERGQIAVRQVLPLPVTVTALVREVAMGGD